MSKLSYISDLGRRVYWRLSGRSQLVLRIFLGYYANMRLITSGALFACALLLTIPVLVQGLQLVIYALAGICLLVGLMGIIPGVRMWVFRMIVYLVVG